MIFIRDINVSRDVNVSYKLNQYILDTPEYNLITKCSANISAPPDRIPAKGIELHEIFMRFTSVLSLCVIPPVRFEFANRVNTTIPPAENKDPQKILLERIAL